MDKIEPGIIKGLRAIKTLLKEERRVINECPFLRLPEYFDLFNDVHARSIGVIGQGRDLTQQIKAGSTEVKKELDQFKEEFEKIIQRERNKYKIAKNGKWIRSK